MNVSRETISYLIGQRIQNALGELDADEAVIIAEIVEKAAALKRKA